MILGAFRKQNSFDIGSNGFQPALLSTAILHWYWMVKVFWRTYVYTDVGHIRITYTWSRLCMGWWRSFCDWHTVKTFLGVGWTSEYPTKMVIKLCRYIHIGSVMHLLGRHPQKKTFTIWDTAQIIPSPHFFEGAVKRLVTDSLIQSHVCQRLLCNTATQHFCWRDKIATKKQLWSIFLQIFSPKKVKTRQLLPLIFFFAGSFIGCQNKSLGGSIWNNVLWFGASWNL